MTHGGGRDDRSARHFLAPLDGFPSAAGVGVAGCADGSIASAALILRIDGPSSSSRHAIFLIAVGAMVALSVFVTLRSHQTETTISPSYGGLISDPCVAAPDNGQIPKEYARERHR